MVAPALLAHDRAILAETSRTNGNLVGGFMDCLGWSPASIVELVLYCVGSVGFHDRYQRHSKDANRLSLLDRRL